MLELLNHISPVLYDIFVSTPPPKKKKHRCFEIHLLNNMYFKSDLWGKGESGGVLLKAGRLKKPGLREQRAQPVFWKPFVVL